MYKLTRGEREGAGNPVISPPICFALALSYMKQHCVLNLHELLMLKDNLGSRNKLSWQLEPKYV